MENQTQDELTHYTKSPILETIGVTKVYKVGDQMVTPISDITLQVGYGDFVVIFGPSGAGKSTLLDVLMGVEKPDVGQVLIKSESFYDLTPEERAMIRLKRFGLIPQDQIMLDQLNILDNVALPLILQGEKLSVAREKARGQLVSFQLAEYTNRKPTELSSGQKQKASIARALINDPWILFADEPTGHLDTRSVEEVMEILVTANRRDQRTIVVVTHDMEFLKHSRKWLFVKDGRLWDIKNYNNPFHNIKEAIDYVEARETFK